MNDSDSDGGSFSELSDSDMCKVNSPFSSSSSEEEEVLQSGPDRGRTEHAGPFLNVPIKILLEWKEKTQDGSETCLLQSTRDKYKFPYNSRQFSLGYI